MSAEDGAEGHAGETGDREETGNTHLETADQVISEPGLSAETTLLNVVEKIRF